MVSPLDEAFLREASLQTHHHEQKGAEERSLSKTKEMVPKETLAACEEAEIICFDHLQWTDPHHPHPQTL